MKRQTCLQCNRPQSVCFCHSIKSVENQWPIWILQHRAEKKHAIGTAKIAQLSLKNINTFDDRSDESHFRSELVKSQLSPVIIYPGEDTINIDSLINEPVRPLLFLDGSWRKTRKMLFDYPELEELPRLTISPDSESRYRIRKEPDKTSVSTLEAIVYLLSYLENSPDKYQSLLTTMDWMINKQIECMGQAVYQKNY